ncbi:MAG TPA: PEP-CTERM sorting domain-containing protein [Chthoniobacteraceae bacterium]|nr:PEP-CTERM sorting domain-containing protein [Chthoniobacteraceae bacterium]
MTNPPRQIHPVRRGFGGWLLAMALLGATILPTQAATWNSETAEGLWSDSDNWTGGAPASSDVVFNTTGRTARDTVGNIVDESLTIRSLTHGHTGPSLWQVTRINADVTLTVQGGTGNLVDIGDTGTTAIAQVAIEGDGKLLLNQSDAHLLVSGRDTTPSTTLDLSGLATFEATVSEIRVGYGRVAANDYKGVLFMARSNRITADRLLIASYGSGTQTSRIYHGEVHLGATNDWNIAEVNVGSARGLGLLQFQKGVSNGVLTLQGKESTPELRTRANLNIGITGGGNDPEYGGIADLTGGTVDAWLDTLRLAVISTNAAVSVEGNFLMDTGTVDALSVVIGQKISAGSLTTGEANGLLDIAGGRLTTQSLTLAEQPGTQGKVTAQLKIHGEGEVEVTQGGITMGTNGTTSTLIVIEAEGKLTVEGAIAKGSGTTDATLRLSGGLLDLNGHAISVDNFQAEGGTLRDAGEINGGAGWSKTSEGTLALEGTHSHTGRIAVAAGTLLLEGNLLQANVTLHEEAAFSMGSEAALRFNLSDAASDQFIVQSGGSASFSGAFLFHLQQPELEAGSWTLLSGTSSGDYAGLESITLGGALSGSLHDNGSGIWQYQSESWLGEFDTSTGTFSLAAVPEPSTWALASLAFGFLLWSGRRNLFRKNG